MSRGTAMEQTAQRVDRLVRALVGVDDLRFAWDSTGRLAALHVLRNGCIAEHQLIRNIVSGLNAGLGLRVEGNAIRVYADGDVFLAAVTGLGPAPSAVQPTTPSRDVAEVSDGAVSADTPAPATQNGGSSGQPTPAPTGAAPAGHTNGHGASNGDAYAHRSAPNGNGSNGASRNGHGHPGTNGSRPSVNGRSAGDPATADGDALVLERLTLERQGRTLRCRVVLALDDHRYSAIAEAPDGPDAEAELAARVTLDALRAGALTCAHLAGIATTNIAGITYVVAAVRPAGSDVPQASAAPLLESIARAAAQAILNVVGPITTVQRKVAERRLGKL